MTSGAPARFARLSSLADAMAALRGWRRVAVTILAGGLSVLAFAPWHAFPILFLTLPVLVWMIDGSGSARSAAGAGWLFGFGYFLVNLFWIGEAFLVEADKFAVLMPLAVTLLPGGLAFFWAAAAAAARTFWREGAMRAVVLAIAITLAEWLRGHLFTGLPWNVIGYALTYPLELMQSASVLGVYALSLPAVVIFALPLVMLSDARRTGASRFVLVGRALAAGILPLVALYGFGTWRLAATSVGTLEGVKLRLVQPSVPQREKWMASKQGEIFGLHLDLSTRNAQGVRDDLAGVTHVVWPEAAMPFLPLEHPEALNAIGALLPEGRVLITGALRREPREGGRQAGFNSLLAFDEEGRHIATYDKTHLVPFGEYLPLEPVLSAIGLTKLTQGLGSFQPGAEPRPPLAIPGLPPAAGLICYEALFPGAVVDDGQRPGVLVNVTNDGWFGDTSGPRQHFHQARVRAVEEGLPLIRVANNGISGIIDPVGRVRARIELNARGVADSSLPAQVAPTTYVNLRLLTLVLTVLTAIAALGVASRRRT